jgi:hypothetical protein
LVEKRVYQRVVEMVERLGKTLERKKVELMDMWWGMK